MVVIFHKHIVLSVKLRKSERMNVSHKIPTARMQVYSDSDKKYFYMHDLTDKFVCAHCMHACRIHACRILSIFSTHLTVLVPMLPVSGYTLRMYRYLGWPISATLACLLVGISILNQDSASLSEIGRPRFQLGRPISATSTSRSTDFILLKNGPQTESS